MNFKNDGFYEYLIENMFLKRIWACNVKRFEKTFTFVCKYVFDIAILYTNRNTITPSANVLNKQT